jgi:hypothetical protein
MMIEKIPREGDNPSELQSSSNVADGSGGNAAPSIEGTAPMNMQVDIAPRPSLVASLQSSGRGTRERLLDRRGRERWDLSSGRTLEDALGYLDSVNALRSAEYAGEWFAEVRDIGCSAYVEIDEAGQRFLMSYVPCDEQERERSRRMRALADHMDGEDQRERVMDYLEEIGLLSDNRAADPALIKRVVRDFLDAGYLLRLTPEGELATDIGVGMPGGWGRGDSQRDKQIEDAGRAFLRLSARWRNELHLKRIVRTLGYATKHGWKVLRAPQMLH